MNALYVLWQDPQSRRWFPVGQLTRESDQYRFVYTRGAEQAKKFVPFGRMTDIKKEYRSESLFPLFSNRLLPKSRPEYTSYLRWTASEHDDPLQILGRTGGLRATDSLMMYLRPQRTEGGKYDVSFFVHGLRYLTEDAMGRTAALKEGDRIFPLLDLQNPFDKGAVALRTNDPPTLVGYCPRHIASDVQFVLNWNLKHGREFQMNVERVNLDAPLQLRFMCRARGDWPNHFKPCSDPEFEPLVRHAISIAG